ncbi:MULTISPECIES: hypothetical protein [unclassified Spirillospora]|uniref:hypothetical protein n=1 Tax=unclassified Spirillospora TaxID=2642701 RepID=UPI00371E26C9
MFKAAVAFLFLSTIAYGFVEFSGEGQSGPLAETRTPFAAIIYGAILIWVAAGGREARTAMLWAAVVSGASQWSWAHGPEGLVSYLVALAASALGVVLLYRPKSGSYLDVKESQIAAAQVRRLFEERGRGGERLHTVSGIAAILGMSGTTVYQHLTPDQRRQVPPPPDEV